MRSTILSFVTRGIILHKYSFVKDYNKYLYKFFCHILLDDSSRSVL